MKIGTSHARREQNRLFVAGMLLAAALNGLFALVHTLGSASPFAAEVWRFASAGGFMVVAGVFVGAYFFAYHDQRPGLALSMAMVAALSQIHIFYTQPTFWGGRGWPYYVVDTIALVVVGYDWRLQRKALQGELAQVVTLTSRSQEASRPAA